MIEGYKTIGEVAKETGLSVREIKYYSERKIVSPSKEYYQGNKKYNLYSDVDIIKIQQIALYRELGYSKDQIKEIISNPDFNWKDALDSQIAELRVLKKHIENKIIAAEFIRFIFQQEKIKDFDISDFDNNIDSFATDLTEFFSPEAEEKTNDSLMNVTSDILNNISIESYEESARFKPILGNVKAGYDAWAIEDIEGYIEVGKKEALKGDYFLRVRGDSMEGANIYSGDLVFVKQCNTLEQGKIGIILIGDEATIKKVYFKNNLMILEAANPKIETKYYTKEEIENIPVRIIGKALFLRRNLD